MNDYGKYDDEYPDDDTGPGRIHPVILFIVFLAATAVTAAGAWVAYDIFTRFIPGL